VELTVRDLARSRAFYVDCLGYLISAEEPEALYLRAVEERNHHSIVLRKGKEPAAHTLGFKVASDEDLDRAADWFKRRNLPVTFPDVPYQGRTLRTADVTGMPLEFYFKMDQGERMLQRYAAYQGARIQRIDHINCFTPGRAGELRLLYRAGLPPDRIHRDRRHPRSQALGGVAAPQGQRHDLAFTNGRGPRLHHIGVWTAGTLDILHLCDVMATSGYLANMERGPGRHGISNAFFLYIRDPDGHRIELFTSDYLTVDPGP
jgi:catechol 2,3-dioxygenase